MVLSVMTLLGWNHAHAGTAGEVAINERVFTLSDDATISIDDDDVTFDDMRGRIGDGGGMRADTVVAIPNATLTSGTVTRITFENNFKGPITSTVPLRVLGQPFTVNGDTVLVGFNSVSQLAVGQFLEVSGFVDTNSSIVASRVALDSAPNQWKLTGFITQFNGAANEATVGSPPGGQTIRFVGVTPTGCGAGPAVGDHIDARANPIVPFVPGQIVDTVTQLRCRPIVPIGTAGAQGSFEGLIQLIVGTTSFRIAGYTVTHGASTFFKFGNVDDLADGVRVEVEGTFGAATAFNARRIKFIRPSIRFRAPVAPAGVVPGVSITILGKTVGNNLQNRDDDAIMANGLTATTHVEVRAYIDSTGQLFATRVRSRGNPDSNDYKLQALVETITRPNLTALGLTIDTGSSIFQDRTNAPITADQFFAAVAIGTLVEIEDASFDALNNRLFGGIVSLADNDDAQASLLLEKGPTSALVGGTVSKIVVDAVFADGYESP